MLACSVNMVTTLSTGPPLSFLFYRMFPSPGLPCHYPADPAWGCEVCVLSRYTELHTQPTESDLPAAAS